MRFYIIFFFTVFAFSLVHAQDWRVLDSLCYEYGESNPDSAIIYGKKAIEGCIKEKGKNSLQYAVCLDHIAWAYKSVSNYQKSDSLYKEAKYIAEHTNNQNTKEYIEIINNTGLLYLSTEKFSLSESLLKSAREISANLLNKESSTYALISNNLGMLYKKQGRYDEAILIYDEALRIINKTENNNLDAANLYDNIGVLFNLKGDYTKAELMLKKALSIRKKFQERYPLEYIKSINNLAVLYIYQGKYKEAEWLLQDKAMLSSSFTNRADVCNNLASVYQKMAMYKEAELYYKEAIDEYEQKLGKNNLKYATSCDNLASLYQIQKKYNQAESLYIMAKNIREHKLGKKSIEYAISCNNLAYLYTELNQYSSAESLYKEAINTKSTLIGKNNISYANTCDNLANLYKLKKDIVQSELYFNSSLSIKLKQIWLHFASLSEYEKEKFIQSNFSNTVSDFNSFVAEYYKSSPKITETGYNIMIQTKGMLLQSSEKIKNRILNSNDENLKKMYLDWKKRKDDYVKAQNLTIQQRKQKGINLDSMAIQINELEKELSLKSEDFANTFTPKTVTWKDIQNTLKKDQAAIEMVQVNAKQKLNDKDSIVYMALIVKKSSSYPEVVVLPNGNELESKYITNYRRSIQSKMADELSYNAFWKPIKEKLKGTKTVYFSPDGIYHQINLNTLQNPETKKYVSDEVQIINVTNTKDILNKRTYTTKNNYLIGNPKFDLQTKTEENNEKPKQERTFEGFFEGVSQLEGAEKEVKQISAVLPSATTIIGTDATEEYIKSLKNPRILHIATHGYFKKGQYQSSTQAMLNAGLLFAGVVDYDRMDIRPFDKEDGKLTAFEVMNMELDSTELVVLSACETGLGQASKEGVYGLQRAFKVAGAQSIIMSLWKVNDEATQLLMTKFYENWQKKGMDKRKAFETAQKDLRKTYKEPYYWGAFVMIE